MLPSYRCLRSVPITSRTPNHTSFDPQQRLFESRSPYHLIPTIRDNDCAWPARLSRRIKRFSPGLWVIPSRCYWRQNKISDPIYRGSQLFYRFKAGHSQLALPLALTMYEVLKRQHALTFDCVVPIPLSPDKQQTGQIDRARILAEELAALLGIPIANLLTLRGPISKRTFLSTGRTLPQFEYHYHQLLQVDGRITEYLQILLVDDVCTHGSTLNCALQTITQAHPHSELTATTAGQMILKRVVTDEHLILAPQPPLLFEM